MTTLIDLSHTIEHGMITYKGLPAPLICDFLSREASRANYSEGTTFHIGKIEMVANTGTYLDTPAHRYRDGHDLAGLELSRCAHLPTVVIDATGPIGAEQVAGTDVAGRAVLLRTGWSRHWGTAAYGDPVHPHLTGEGAHALAEGGAALVGIDSVNIDDTTTGARPAHTVLLGAGIPVVEHLKGLDQLPVSGAFFSAVPPAIRGLATFPVRAFALVPA